MSSTTVVKGITETIKKGITNFKSTNYHQVVAYYGVKGDKLNKEKYFLKILAESKETSPYQIQKRREFAKLLNIEENDLIELQNKVDIHFKNKKIIFTYLNFNSGSLSNLNKTIEKYDKFRKIKLEIIESFLKEKNINLILPEYLYDTILFEVEHDYRHTEIDDKGDVKEDRKNYSTPELTNKETSNNIYNSNNKKKINKSPPTESQESQQSLTSEQPQK